MDEVVARVERLLCRLTRHLRHGRPADRLTRTSVTRRENARSVAKRDGAGVAVDEIRQRHLPDESVILQLGDLVLPKVDPRVFKSEGKRDEERRTRRRRRDQTLRTGVAPSPGRKAPRQCIAHFFKYVPQFLHVILHLLLPHRRHRRLHPPRRIPLLPRARTRRHPRHRPHPRHHRLRT